MKPDSEQFMALYQARLYKDLRSMPGSNEFWSFWRDHDGTPSESLEAALEEFKNSEYVRDLFAHIITRRIERS